MFTLQYGIHSDRKRDIQFGVHSNVWYIYIFQDVLWPMYVLWKPIAVCLLQPMSLSVDCRLSMASDVVLLVGPFTGSCVLLLSVGPYMEMFFNTVINAFYFLLLLSSNG